MSAELADQLTLHVGRMYRVAVRIVGDPDGAQDVVQEACIKAISRADHFQGRSSLATWLHTITVNCARDHLRGQSRSQREIAGLQAVTAAMGAVQNNPAVDAQKREMYRKVMDLVDELPEECRTAFVLTQLDGYSYDEAAAIEDQQRGTMASRVFRAKKILLALMNETDPREPS